MARDPLLSVRGLEKHYPITEGVLRREVGRVRAVDGISFDVYPGETFGLIGETGCGKSTAARTLLRLEDPTAGAVVLGGENVTAYGDRALKRFRRRAQMVFQDPTSSFDPRMRVGESVAEPLVAHGMGDRDRRRAVVDRMLDRVGLGPAAYDRHPHELSGGQKQRAALARALVVNPDLLVADEPVSALDVSVQAEILSLLAELQGEFDLSVLFITHDMNVVREICDRVAVMYLGELVEVGPTDALLEAPQHPYTEAMVASIPTPDPGAPGRRRALRGDVPDPYEPPTGCRFHPRCPEVIPPAAYDLEPSEWRRLLDLRLALEDGTVDLDGLRERAGSDDTTDSAGGTSPLRTILRSAHGLPPTLSDEAAETVLSSALEAAADGDFEAAADRLRAEFRTVCERRRPQLQETESGHPAACHLHGLPD